MNKFLAGSGGVSSSTRIPTGVVDCVSGSNRLRVGLVGKSSESKVSRRL